MVARRLYVAAYDVADSRRLARALRTAREYASGGQRSVHECFLADAEVRALWRDMSRLLRPPADRFFLLRLDPRSRAIVLGIGYAPENPTFFYQE